MKLIVVLLIVVLTASLTSADPRLWNPPLAVRQGAHIEWSQNTASDANGNVLMVWADAHTGDLNVYAQLLDPDGLPQWTEGGIPVVSAPGSQRLPAVVAVTGGWIVAWQDERNPLGGGYGSTWVWAQKLNESGQPMWLDHDQTGVMIEDESTGYDVSDMIQLSDDEAGGAMVVWRHYSSMSGNSLRAQRVTSTGSRAWPAILQPCSLPIGIYSFVADGDGSGNMLVAWEDNRGGLRQQVYATVITSAGLLPWAINGVQIGDTACSNQVAGIARDGSGGAIVVWQKFPSESPIICAQRLNRDGLIQWQATGVIVCNADIRFHRKIDVKPSWSGPILDGCLVAWEDDRVNGVVQEIYAQKISLQGAEVWPANGLKICGNATGNSNDPHGQTRCNPSILTDGAGGLEAVWDDYRADSVNHASCDLYAARVTASGTMPWNGDGVRVADGPLNQCRSALQFHNSIVVAYDDFRDGSQSLRTQTLTVNGLRMQGDSGTVIAAGWDRSCWQSRVVAMSGGRTAYVWVDERTDYSSQLYFQISNAEGQCEKAVGGVPLLSSCNMDYSGTCLCEDGNGGFYVVFLGYRESNHRIRAIHVNAAGNIDSNPEGELICVPSGTTEQYSPMCVTDGHGGAYVAWLNYNQTYERNSYVMRINASCRPVWAYPVQLAAWEDNSTLFSLASAADGSSIVGWHSGDYGALKLNAARILPQGFVVYNRQVSDDTVEYDEAGIVADAEGGAYVVWANESRLTRNTNIFAQRLSAMGQDVWARNGIAVASDTFYQSFPKPVVASNGDLIVLWSDYRNENDYDIYGQKVSRTGACLWASEGVPVCAMPGYQYLAKAVSDGDDGVFAIWLDNQTSGRGSIFGTHLLGNGAPAADPFWVPNRGGPIFDTTGLDLQSPDLALDGQGGFIVTVLRCYSREKEEYYTDLYAQRIQNSAYAVNEHPAAAFSFDLAQNYPNPFNPSTTISFSLPQAGKTQLTVYNLLGEEVARLADRVMSAGQYRLSFDGSAFSSGVYFYRLQSGNLTVSRKMLLLK